MILKRPFAFFIKHFRFIHFILASVTIYLAYNTANIISFFNQYMQATVSLVDKDVTARLFPIIIFLFIFIALIASTVILILMKWKNKPILFYIVNIVNNVYIWGIYIYSKQIVKQLETNYVQIRSLKLVHDLLIIGLILQTISIIITIIRSTGFDIKKFNFKEDLDLEIDDLDNEEFEFDVDVDTDSFRRNLKRNIRSIKYIYKENKVTIFLICMVIIGIICSVVYFNLGVYRKKYKEGNNFRTTYFSFGVVSSYSTSRDYQDTKITNNRLIVVKVKAKNMTKYDLKLETSKIALTDNNAAYYPNVNYQGKFIDLGTVYVNSEISQNNFDEYLLVFELPESSVDKKLYLKYYDTKDKTITVSIKPIELDQKEVVDTYNLNDTLSLDGSLMGNTKLTINSFEIGQKFKETYKYCTSIDNCYNSYEYIVPLVEDDYDKTLIKISGQISFDEKLSIKKTDDLGEFITNYAKLKYEIDGKEKIMPVTMKQIKPKKTVSKYNNYLEVYKEIENADKITLIITIRNKVYNYNLK